MLEIHGRTQGNDDHVVCGRAGYYKTYETRFTATIPYEISDSIQPIRSIWRQNDQTQYRRDCSREAVEFPVKLYFFS